MLSYVAVTFFLVITPGATTAVVIQNALRHGHRGGAAAALGAALGNSSHALATGVGLALLLRTWPQMLVWLRLAGGLFLCWLAVQSLRRAWSGGEPNLSADRRASAPASRTALREGLIVTLMNPSIATFYLAVLPGFLAPGAGFPAFALLAAIHITMALSCHMVWALVFDTLRHRLASPAGLRRLDALAGAALLILGLQMLVA